MANSEGLGQAKSKGRPVDATSYLKNEMKWLRGEARHLRALSLELTRRADSLDSEIQATLSHGHKVDVKNQKRVWQYRQQSIYLKAMVKDFREQSDIIKADMARIVESIDADKQDIKEGDIIIEPEFKKIIVVTKESLDIMNKIMNNETTEQMYDRLFEKDTEDD